MRILQCMASVDLAKGGPSTAVRALSAAFLNLGHDVTVIGNRDPGVSAVSEEGIVLFDLTVKRAQFSFRYAVWACRNIRTFDAVIIHSLFLPHTTVVSFLCWYYKIPFALRPHGSLNEADLARRRLLKVLYLRTVARIALRDARFIFCTSNREAHYVRQWSNARVEVIPLGIQWNLLPCFDEQRARSNRVLFLGRLSPKKGVDVLLEALARLRAGGVSVSCDVVGGSIDRWSDSYKRLADVLDLDFVHFHDFADSDARRVFLSEADVFVLPSLDENFGIAAAEALGAGVPVVLTPGVSHAQLVADFGGGVVVQREVEAVASGIRSVLQADDETFLRLRREALALARRMFDWDKCASRLVECFDLS